MSELPGQLRAFMEKESLSLRRCARAIGISTGALSEWMNDRYKCNTDSLDSHIRSFLERQRDLVQDRKENPLFVITSVTRKVFEVGRICHLDREIGVCYGSAGLGKTEAVREYARQNHDVIFIEVDLGHTAKALFSELHKRLGFDGFGTVHAMFTDVVGKLKDSEGMIIVDEAEHLPYKALELIRRVHDKAGIGIMLVGLPRLISNLRGKRGEYAQLYSRVGIAARLDGLRPSDTQMIVESTLPSANGLGKIFHAASNGNTRILSKLLARSTRVAELNGITLSATVIKETARMLIV